MNRNERPMYTLRISASDPEGLVAEGKVEITVLESNDPPTVNDTTRSILENAKGAEVGAPVLGSDPDFYKGQRLTYSIQSGDEKGYFTINPVSGQIMTTGIAKLDHETKSRYWLKVKATDDGKGTLSDACV